MAPMRRRPQAPGRHHGFTLIEVLFALMILGLIMMTSLAVFYEHERRSRHAEETVLVWQAISNEAELVRLRSWASLVPDETSPFQSDLAILDSIENAATAVEVAQPDAHVKHVTLRIEWGDTRTASATVIRTDTGGTNLW